MIEKILIVFMVVVAGFLVYDISKGTIPIHNREMSKSK